MRIASIFSDPAGTRGRFEGMKRATADDGRTRRVLVVDDEVAIRMICAINLEAEGFSVIEASDGSEGLELARSECPDLIVTDVKMPRCDGFEFAESLRRDEQTREIPVVFMSGCPDEVHETRARGLGALAFLSKPFDPKELTTIALSVLA
jgi:CheY-like chemotaxis protein